MAEISVERRGQLVRGVFEVLLGQPEGMRSRDLLPEVEKLVAPTPWELTDYPTRPGVRRYENYIRFSTIGAVKAGWLLKTKGIWTVTDEGRDAYAAYTDPAEFMRESSRRYRLWKQERDESTTEADVEQQDEDETASIQLEIAEESASEEIRSYLANMLPYDFQKLVAALLRAMGYHVPWIAPPGRDGGVDVIAFTDPLGASGPRIKVQVKRQQAKVAVDGLRSFLAVLGTQDNGLFVSLGGFTADAETEARAQDNRRVLLLDADQFVNLWTDHYDNVKEEDKQLLPLTPVYFLMPRD